MKRIWFAILLSFYFTTGMLAKGNYAFKADSRLSEGKWVKIETGVSGLYQIPYSLLNEMGFKNPDKVGVWGKGGRVYSINFTDASEALPYSDDIEQIAVIHDNNSLYFYAQGVENIVFETGKTPLFRRNAMNIYSNSGYYFLSDCEDPCLAAESESEGMTHELLQGWGYVYHEKDLQLNTTNTGQLFWGESLLNPETPSSWTLPSPLMTSGTAHLAYRVYTSPSSNGTIGIELKDSESPYSFTFSSFGTDKFWEYPASASANSIEYKVKASECVTLRINATNSNADFINLDYWLLSYPKILPETGGISANAYEHYSFAVTAGESYSLPLPENYRVLDITIPRKAVRGRRLSENPSAIGIKASSDAMSLIVYDNDRQQRQITGWKEVTNNNLHALRQTGADLLIVTVPRFRTYAEQIAELHRIHDGITVAVATPEEIYNEFSGGCPDPMAYRAFARMLYNSSAARLRNILLLGPSDRNIRHNVSGETIFDRIIAPQQPNATPGRDASPAYDLYGIMADAINETQLYREKMEVGVGLLSCETESECEKAIRKIGEYLEDDSQAWRVNETLTIGGLHDNHTHGQQAEDFGNYIRQYPKTEGIAHTTIAVDAYGNENARRRFVSALDNGKNFTVWFGHGARVMLGNDKKFFTTSEAASLTNHNMGFMYMGGCDFSVPDIRARGLGESIVLDADRGMVGAIVSTRTAWSNQNYDLGKRIVTGWLAPENTDISPTIGEIYAYAKSGTSSSNSMTFILAGDPALRVPSPLRNIDISVQNSVSASEKVKVSGTICDKNGNPDYSFNGKIVLKLMEPARMLRSKDYETGTCNIPVKITNGVETTVYYTLDVTYDTELIAAFETDVTGGRFEIVMTVPEKVLTFTGRDARLVAGAYDKSRKLGAGGESFLTITGQPAEGSERDMEPPRIEISYDNSRDEISVSITDDTALSLDAGPNVALLDGRRISINYDSYCETGATDRQFLGYIDISGTACGTHTCSVLASDLAGNKSSAETTFEKIPRTAPLSVTLSSKAAANEIEITVEGIFSVPLDYEIIDSEGKLIWKSRENTGSIFWDCRDIQGKRAAPGLYRVRVRETGKSSPSLYSEWQNFAVLQ